MKRNFFSFFSEKKFLILILGAVINSSSLKAQNTDLWQWNTISIEKKISKRFVAQLDEEVRFQNNISRLNLCYTNIGAGYRISKYFKIAFFYRFLQKFKDDNSFSLRHRFYTDLSFRSKYDKFTLSYRARIQTQVRDVNSSEYGSDPESYLRNKFDLKYDTGSKWKPNVAAEFRYQFGNRHQKEANYTLNRGRYYVGAVYEFNSSSELGLYYMLQKDYHIKDPGTEHVLGIAYSLAL